VSDDRAPKQHKSEDGYRKRAVEMLATFFDANREQVFYSRQLEVMNERLFYHWITNAAVHEVRDRGLIEVEESEGVMLLRHKSYRFFRRRAREVLDLIGEYRREEVVKAVGDRGEQLVLEGFAKHQFVQRGRNACEVNGKVWTMTGHNLDFIFERDGIGYGVEVKNVLGYSDLKQEIGTKIELCRTLGIRPVVVARYLPKVWMNDLFKADGFGMLYDVQLYPPLLRAQAERLRSELQLPVEVAGALPDGCMKRFMDWHEENLDPALKAKRNAERLALRKGANPGGRS
jgi:hypothetical protein